MLNTLPYARVLSSLLFTAAPLETMAGGYYFIDGDDDTPILPL